METNIQEMIVLNSVQQVLMIRCVFAQLSHVMHWFVEALAGWVYWYLIGMSWYYPSTHHVLRSNCFFYVEISRDLFLNYCSLEWSPDFHAVVRILQLSSQLNLRNHHCLESLSDSNFVSLLYLIPASMPSYQVIFELSIAIGYRYSLWIDSLTSIYSKNLTWYFDKHCLA